MTGPIAVAALFVAVLSGGAVGQTQHEPTTVDNHPAVVALLRNVDFATSLTACSGVIVNNVAVMTAARCFQDDGPERWSFRAGATFWNSGGTVYSVTQIHRHPEWNEFTMQNDVAVIRPQGFILLGTNVQQGTFTGPSYVVPPNAPVLTVGWGYNSMPLWRPQLYEDMRQLQLANLNLEVCRRYYSPRGYTIRPTQLCSGFIDPEADALARDTCLGDPGSPVYDANAIVAIRSYGLACLNRRDVPSIDTRISAYIVWIVGIAES